MRTHAVGLLLALSLSQSALRAQGDSAKTHHHAWVAVGVQHLGRWGEVVIEGNSGSGKPSRTVLLGPTGNRLGYQVVVGIPTHWGNINAELYGQVTGKRALVDSMRVPIGTVQEVILAVGIDGGEFRPHRTPISFYGAARVGVGLLKYVESVPVGLPKTATAALVSADAGLTIEIAPFLKARVTVGVTPATSGPIFYSATGGLAFRLPL